MHEAGESPQQEALEHMPGQYEEGGESPEAHAGEGGEDVDHLLSQLSPEELEHLATMLAGDMQHSGGMEGGMEGGEHEDTDTHALAQAIQSHLAENPEANPEGASPEKMAALAFVKSAAYIEGFLEQAIGRGASVKVAVDIYDSALSRSIQSLGVEKTAAKKIEMPQEPSEKTAAYYEGVLERAREYGFSDQEALRLVKSAMVQHEVMAAALGKKLAKPRKVKSAPKSAPNKSNSDSRILERLSRSAIRNRGTIGAVGGGLAGLGLGAALSDDK